MVHMACSGTYDYEPQTKDVELAHLNGREPSTPQNTTAEDEFKKGGKTWMVAVDDSDLCSHGCWSRTECTPCPYERDEMKCNK